VSVTEPQQPHQHVLLITLDSCRYDTFVRARAPYLKAIGPLHQAQAPSYFTYGSHAAMWMGFTPGLSHSHQPWLNPKAGKLFRMAHAGFGGHGSDGIQLEGANLVEGFRQLGYNTVGSGSVAWFNPNTATGRVLSQPFEHFFYPGNTWSLQRQLNWLQHQINATPAGQPLFVFLNVGETHVPYWYDQAPWPREPSPCQPFGGPHCSRRESRRRQSACLEWVDQQLEPLLEDFADHTVLVCADHGDCWGEDGLWEHGISHPATLTVPLLLRVGGQPIGAEPTPSWMERLKRTRLFTNPS